MRTIFSGFAVAGAGDVNADGFADLIIGAPGADLGGDSAARATLCLAKPRLPGQPQPNDPGSVNGFRLDGIDGGDQSGFSVASAGDVNGDGFADLIIGAFVGGDAFDAGVELTWCLGRTSGFSSIIDLAALDGTNGLAPRRHRFRMTVAASR